MGKKGLRKRKAKAKGNVLSPVERQRRKFNRAIRQFFGRLNFTRIQTEGKQITFKGRTGEIDDVFVHENVIIVSEYTFGQSQTGHIAKKKILWDLIHASPEAWATFMRSAYKDAATTLADDYDTSEYRVAFCYFASSPASDEIEKCLDYVRFFDPTRFRYFDALAKAIHKSARFELFKYLDLEFKEIGHEVKNSASDSRTFRGLLLPEKHSSFPSGFKIVSFYADPNALLTMSYVLRRDSWRDEEGVYQRVLMKGRMAEMRKYLTSEKRVFVNNIIVTLPSDTSLNDDVDGSKNLGDGETKAARPVSVVVPFRSNAIGIVDGQHRVFCYHEGMDVHENAIAKLRSRQNLLVTGLVYPKAYGDAEKMRFEARLFLEINDKQKRAKSDLKQSIELLLQPYSNVAIAKRVVQRLNSSGALKGLLQTNYFDPPSFLRTTSIVSYGLRPLVKLDGDDSLFKAWPRTDKDQLKDAQRTANVPDGGVAQQVLDAYVEFCAKSINALLIAAKLRHGPEKWKLEEKAKDRILTPTLINGLFVCLRLLVEANLLLDQAGYEGKLKGLDGFSFKKYRSSHWRKLGEEIFTKFFA